jgi:MYXO-CTERM domain-containing protein
MFEPRSTRVALLAIGALALAGQARAYTIETHFTTKCHEKLTAEALRTAREALGLPAAPPTTVDERALIDDLQFAPDPDMRDLAGATLLVGVRDNDLKGNSQDDLTVLSAIHGDPTSQREHCLRGPDRKEPGGTAAALVDCRAFIQQRVLEALDGLDASGKPDLAKRTALGLHLSLRGHVDALLPTYYVRIGQAMHAIQDSFTHTYRTPDGMKVTVALNWLDEVGGGLVEARDGPAHATQLDVCNDPDELRTTRRQLATLASSALLEATLDPAKTRDEKVAGVGRLLDTYLGFAPGCTFDNGWCQAAERQYKDAKGPLGCSSAGNAAEPWAVVAWSALGLLALAGGRRRRWRASVARWLVVAVASTFVAGSARAQTEVIPSPPPAVRPTATSTSTTTPAKPATATRAATPETLTTTTTTTTSTEENTHAPPAPTIVLVEEPGPSDPSQTAWGAALGTSGSIDKPAATLQLGARLKVSKHWTFGLDGEWNPWITINNARVGNGVINLYGTAMLRFPLAYESFNLRAGLSLGTSYLLMNLYGAPSGSLGLYAGVSPAGLEWKLSRTFVLVVNPLSFSLPVPQLSGVPLTYPQYRTSVALEIYKG